MVQNKLGDSLLLKIEILKILLECNRNFRKLFMSNSLPSVSKSYIRVILRKNGIKYSKYLIVLNWIV